MICILQILNCIGKGTFGEVYRICLKHRPNFLFAMKKQLKSEILTRNVVQQVKNEVLVHVSSIYFTALSSSAFVRYQFYLSFPQMDD